MPESRFVRTQRRTLVGVLGCTLVLVGWLLVTPAAPVAAANTLHVTDCGDAGTNTLRGQIAAASLGDTIVFDQNCTGASAITLATGTLTLAQDVTIDGTGRTVVVDGGCALNNGHCQSGGVTVFTVNSGVTASLSTLTIQHGNQALFNGGGIANQGTLTMTNSTVAFNSGGGIYNVGTLSVTDSTITGNTTDAFSDGGGINNYIGGTVTVTNSTITGNTAGYGGGIENNQGTLTLTNTIVAGNSADYGPDVLPGITSGGHNLIGNTALSSGWVGSDLLDVAPLLGPLADHGGGTNTTPLLPGSPAIGAGTSGVGIPTADQRGIARTGHTDIGAFQSQGFSLVRTGGDSQSQQVFAVFTTPLTVTVTATAAGAPWNEPVLGGTLIVTPPGSGASATTSSPPASLPANGQASFMFAANGTAGGPYAVTVSAGGPYAVTYALTNLVAPAHSTYTVGTTADHAGGLTSATTCLTAGNATCTLRDAIVYATSGTDTVVFNGTGQGTITLVGANGWLEPMASMTIDGTGHSVTVDGGCTANCGTVNAVGGVPVFIVDGGVTASINGITIQHGEGLVGGGIENSGTLTITNCTITGNSTPNGTGGGILNGGTLTVTNSTITGNSASNSGGGIRNLSGTLTVTNSTITGNSATLGGGGIVNNAGATVTVTNTIVAGNTAPTGPDLLGTITSGGHNLIGTISGSTGIANGVNGDIINPTPLLGTLGSNGGPTKTIALLTSSPAIGHGDPAVCAAIGTGKVNGVDQRGFPRQAGVCSIGAFEAQPAVPNPLPPSKPPGPAGGPPSPLPAVRPAGVPGGVPNPLPAPRP
jgi:CSLREA domain-containing protein